MEEEIIALYRTNGYQPKEFINELTKLLGAAILSDKNTESSYVSDYMSVTVIVEEHK